MKAPLETETWRHNQTACSARVVWRASSRPAGLRDVAWPISQGRAIAISAGRATTCWAVRTSPHNTTQRRALQSLYSRLRLAAVCGLLCCEWTPPHLSLTLHSARLAHSLPERQRAHVLTGDLITTPLIAFKVEIFWSHLRSPVYSFFPQKYVPHCSFDFYTNPLSVQPIISIKVDHYLHLATQFYNTLPSS